MYKQNKISCGGYLLIALLIIILLIIIALIIIPMIIKSCSTLNIHEQYKNITFDNFIRKVKNKHIKNGFHNYIVTPLAPYLLCDHFVSSEITPALKINSPSNPPNAVKEYYYIFKYSEKITLKIKANDLGLHKNYNTVKNNDIVVVEVTEFENFMNNILPNIDAEIILFTCKYYLPQIQKSDLTDECLNHPKIKLWISQNPIYPNSDKYMAFPYGFDNNLPQYIDYLCKHKHKKTNSIFNPPVTVHDHLPENHIRKVYPELGKNTPPRMQYDQYFKTIAKSQYTISTTGDREDCFRHYEALGLDSIPITDVSPNYKNVFDTNMVYMNANEMISTLKNNTHLKYKRPNKNILMIAYWNNIIREKISKFS